MRTNCASPHQFVLPPPLFNIYINLLEKESEVIACTLEENLLDSSLKCLKLIVVETRMLIS